MSLVAIITDPGKGGTFLSWSLHFLAGHKQYFFARKKTFIDLISNPITDKNAHNFRPNQPNDYNTFQEVLGNLVNCKTNNFHTIYFHNFLEYPFSFESPGTKQAISEVVSATDKFIVVTNQEKNLLYEKSFYGRSLPCSSLTDPTKRLTTDQERFDDFIECFFADSLDTWKKLNLTNIWDFREFLALNYRHHSQTISSFIDLSKRHFDLDFLEWVNAGDLVIKDIFEYLETPLDQSRFLEWKKIYQLWKELHYQRLIFLWNFDKIVNYIVKGKFLDLLRFNLDIYQEAIIQHELIYKYNLNLKTFQLNRFENTLQLNSLLEPNFHNLSKHKS